MMRAAIVVGLVMTAGAAAGQISAEKLDRALKLSVLQEMTGSCYSEGVAALDDLKSDAATIARVISLHCRDYEVAELMAALDIPREEALQLHGMRGTFYADRAAEAVLRQRRKPRG